MEGVCGVSRSIQSLPPINSDQTVKRMVVVKVMEVVVVMVTVRLVVMILMAVLVVMVMKHFQHSPMLDTR